MIGRMGLRKQYRITSKRTYWMPEPQSRWRALCRCCPSCRRSCPRSLWSPGNASPVWSAAYARADLKHTDTKLNKQHCSMTLQDYLSISQKHWQEQHIHKTFPHHLESQRREWSESWQNWLLGNRISRVIKGCSNSHTDFQPMSCCFFCSLITIDPLTLQCSYRLPWGTWGWGPHSSHDLSPSTQEGYRASWSACTTGRGRGALYKHCLR